MPVHLVVGRISELHYICRISNTASILEYEILSHSIADRLPHDSVADPEVQKRRSAKKVPNGRDLHDYANLYFNGRNSMMYSITKSQGVDEICLLRVDVAVLDLPGTVVTDSNAASGHAKFSDPTTGLSGIDQNGVKVSRCSSRSGSPICSRSTPVVVATARSGLVSRTFGCRWFPPGC